MLCYAKLILSSLSLFLAVTIYAQDTDSGNTSSQTGDLNTNQQGATVDSNNTTNTNTNQYNGAGSASEIPVASAVAPSMMSGGNDSCLKSTTGGVSTLQVGLSAGNYRVDEDCNRRKDAQMLFTLNMKIAAITRMCQHDDNWLSMFESGTPCPLIVGGKVVAGKNAYLMMKRKPDLFVRGYEENKEYFDVALGINGETNGEDKENTDGKSVSERYRTTKW
jgi:hypothetical protein|tara:strand:+ start:176 stop:835 length:660 start_codon:yes stop_codon:yes gene_type:complete